MLFPSKVGADGVYEVDEELCNACQQCMKLGCPSMHHTQAVFKKRNKVAIDASTCTGCSLCAQLCKPGAIVKAGTA
jgi:indolepyruvate ferredoxin oxidoreductase alpha subunit